MKISKKDFDRFVHLSTHKDSNLICEILTRMVRQYNAMKEKYPNEPEYIIALLFDDKEQFCRAMDLLEEFDFTIRDNSFEFVIYVTYKEKQNEQNAN